MIIIAGPCQIESYEHALKMAGLVNAVGKQLGIHILFKASFDKANRTSGDSARGAGIDTARRAFRTIRQELGMPCITDVHEPWQAEALADAVDWLQIPALLSRQTDLIEAAARSGRSLNLKKGQFMAPPDIAHAVAKARGAGADRVWVTERGSSFGHRDLVVDMRGIPAMAVSGADAVVFDASHSAQHPGSLDGRSGGNRAEMPVLARAALAAGADGIFVETHDDPDNALSDGPVAWPVGTLYEFLAPLVALHGFVNEQRSPGQARG